ncbi:MAG: twin-arginine translocation signal domain-containing protein [Gammaproteobacteria bacterium]|nr:twin-arginine translocation signal domain-containing protein [Gammaproteobacteria bacterium]
MENNRRDLLKTLTAAGVVAVTIPEQWKKPVVESILLPVHAQTTSEETTSEEVRCLPATIPALTYSAVSCPSETESVESYWRPFITDEGCPEVESISESGPFQNCDVLLEILNLRVPGPNNVLANFKYWNGSAWRNHQVIGGICGGGGSESDSFDETCDSFRYILTASAIGGDGGNTSPSASIGPVSVTLA